MINARLPRASSDISQKYTFRNRIIDIAEARSVMANDPDGWAYVELWDGAAAQRCAFGSTRRAPDLVTLMSEPEPVWRDPDQGDLFSLAGRG